MILTSDGVSVETEKLDFISIGRCETAKELIVKENHKLNTPSPFMTVKTSAVCVKSK